MDEFEETIEAKEEAEEEEVEEEAEAKEEPVSIETLQSQVGELQKESEGRLRALRAERQERQELKNKVETVASMVNQVKAEKQGKKTAVGVPVSYDDDDNPYVDPAAITADLQRQVADLQRALLNNQTAQKQQALSQAEVSAVVGKDPSFESGIKTLNKAYNFISRHLDELVLKRGIDPKALNDIGDALDLVEGSESFMAEFTKLYPNLTPDLVVEAILPNIKGNVNKRKLTQALNTFKSVKKKEEGLSKTLKFLTKKPSNLASVRNQGKASGTSLDVVANMDIDDFLGMSDQQVKELERVLYDEEMQG